MASSGKVKLSPDELFATIERSSLPTIIVEGDDDIIVFRRLEQLFSEITLSVQAAGGRNIVLELFKRRINWRKAPKVLFIADRDAWIYSNVPDEYESADFILSDGYSIENDVFRDGRFVRLLDSGEKEKFISDLKAFVFWYTHCVAKTMEGSATEYSLATHPSIILGRVDGFFIDE